MKKIHLYSDAPTDRLRYVCSFFWGQDIVITTDKQAYLDFRGAKINYSPSSIDGASEIHIVPNGLLSESGIRAVSVAVQSYGGVPFFFENKSGYPFDVFAAAFYLLSRYEEYLPYEKDRFGRYDAKNSLAFQNDFLQLPLVDIWKQQLEKALHDLCPDVLFQTPAFCYRPTFDIDVAFAYQYRSFPRQAYGFVKDLAKGCFSQARMRIAVLTGRRKDPFDIYDELLMHVSDRNPLFFFPLARQVKAQDHNILPSVKPFRTFVYNIASQCDVGLHPSWQSGDDIHLLEAEKNILETITGRTVQNSRQHYIRMTLPETYRRLLSLGFTDDYSMGYPVCNGFRASTSRSFYWFDLGKNEQTNLRVHPFGWMDANCYYQLHQTPAQAVQELQQLLNEVRRTGGTFISVHHNQFFTLQGDFSFWRDCIYSFWESLKKE